MIKVIEHGYRKYHTTCHNCKCYFEYEIDDVNSKGEVQCPDCKRNCHHCATLNANLTSKFKDIDINAAKEKLANIRKDS